MLQQYLVGEKWSGRISGVSAVQPGVYELFLSSYIRAVPEIILGGGGGWVGGLQAHFCPVEEGVLLTMCPRGGGNLSWGSRHI